MALAGPAIPNADCLLDSETSIIDPRRPAFINGVVYLPDIRFRMLHNRDLTRAMGFDKEDYQHEFHGPSKEVTAQISIAVSVRTVKWLITVLFYPHLLS